METPCWQPAAVDTSRPHFEVIHSLFKQTAGRVGWNRAGDAVAFEFLLPGDQQAEEVRRGVTADLSAKLARLAPAARTLAELFDLLGRSCCHPSNLYTEVHWLPILPGCPEPGA